MPKRIIFPWERDASCELRCIGLNRWSVNILTLYPYISPHLSCPVTSANLSRATRSCDASKMICRLRLTSKGQVGSPWDKALIKLSLLQGQGQGLARQPITSSKSWAKFMRRASCSCSKSQGRSLFFAPSLMSLWTTCRGRMCPFFLFEALVLQFQCKEYNFLINSH